MQALVYIFIIAIGVALGAAAYTGFGFTIIESVLVAGLTVAICMMLAERTLRMRSEKRFEKAVDDLSRLLSTDAQAGQVLAQRINALADIEADERLKTLEADMSVLGTVVRQVAEAVAELETSTVREKQDEPEAVDEADQDMSASVTPELDPVIPPQLVREALDQGRLVFHMQPIITLPQRRTYGYDLIPRLKLEDGDLADAPDFMPQTGGEDIIRHIERQLIDEAITVVRRAKTSGEPASLFLKVSSATLANKSASDALGAVLEANRVVAQSLVLCIEELDWRSMGPKERARVATFRNTEVQLSIINAQSLRLDYSELSGLGFSSVRADAQTFIEQPETLTDFEIADLAPYLDRFDIDLIVEGVRNEQQILTVLDDGIKFAIGPHIARPSPIRPDLMIKRQGTGDGKRAKLG